MSRLIRKAMPLGAVFFAALVSPSMPVMNKSSDAEMRLYAAKCKAASFARRGPGMMATTMRELEIDRCVKNKGRLD
jgi:hypothetical protein